MFKFVPYHPQKLKNIPISPPVSNFPSDVLKWIKQNNAKPKLLLKLEQICKYFQIEEFPYTVVINLWGHCKHNLSHWSYQPLGFNIRLNVKTFNKPLWILDSLRLTKFDKLPETAVCDLYTIVLAQVEMSIKEFKFLTAEGKVSQLYLNDSVIRGEDGKVLPFEKLFEYLPNVNSVQREHDKIYLNVPLTKAIFSHKFENSIFSYQEAAKLGENISYEENYNTEECFDFFQKNQHISFNVSIFGHRNEEFIQRLQGATDKLIKVWSSNNKPPEIFFENQSPESKNELESLHQIYKKFQK